MTKNNHKTTNDKDASINRDFLLWAEIKKGNSEALSEMFYKYYDDLFFYGKKFTCDNNRIEDTIQNVFIKIWEYRNKNYGVVYIKTYVFKIFRNELLRKKNKLIFSSLVQNNSKYLDKNFSISCEDLIIEKETRSEEKALISDLLKILSPRQKEIIYLKFYLNFSNTEISNTLSINKQSVSNMLNRIFIDLRKKIKKQ
jgi:RNA polymerase sigma factor (sigma-70 family)